ncbi:MAG: dienelactone hydrolase family protein [Microthrixaceae bacterium]
MRLSRSSRPVLLVIALASLLVAGSCSSTDEPDGGEPTTTTAAAADGPTEAAYAERGSHQVGTMAFSLDDGRRVQAWYPATDEAAELPKETFDIAGLLNPDLQAQIPEDKRPIYEINAHPDADAASDGPYPVVLFSHGFAGFPEQSADLVTHLASWGFVVIAPDHVERSLSGQLGVAAQGIDPREDPEVLSASLDTALALPDDSPLTGLLDEGQVTVAGHSAGAGAAYRTASSDDRIKAFIAYSVGNRLEDGEEPPPVPEVPGMVMAGTSDGIIPFATSEEVYQGMNPPKYLVTIEGAGHLVFSDICLVGKDMGGLVGLIDEVGLDLPEQITRLASDGCEDDQLDPARAFSAMDHLSVAFLRSSLGIDAEPVGLDPDVTENFADATITLTADAN